MDVQFSEFVTKKGVLFLTFDYILLCVNLSSSKEELCNCEESHHNELLEKLFVLEI